MRAILAAAAFAGALAVVAADERAGGQAGPEISAVQGPCAGDLQRFCRNITPGAGRQGACLKSYENQLSLDCQQEILSAEARWRRALSDCGNEMGKYCPGVQPNATRMMECLGLHESELSPRCHERVEEFGGQALGLRGP